MAHSLTFSDLQTALPECMGTVQLRRLEGPVEVFRDSLGIPHLRASSVHDAFFAQGFVHAQDRLWQMDYDRHRAYGRWAEYAGVSALAHDVLMRRFRLEASVQTDYAAVNQETRAMLDAYAEGVNAFLQTTARFPIEYRLIDATPEPWQPWDACAVFKVRHIFTGGVWQAKLWRARLLRLLGPELTAKLCEGYQPGHPLIIPPGVDYTGQALDSLKELAGGSASLALMRELDGGSNSWVLAGGRTATGSPLLAGDPHRALDTPNVFYQNHVACPEFDAVGFSFPGVPGFSHFGHNRAVAWCVTTAMADQQDLYIERINPNNPRQYEFKGQWLQAEHHRETIHVRSGQATEIEVCATHHGPIVAGDPSQGYALAFRYTAMGEPNVGFNTLLPMLRATSADDLEEAMRPWVDPCNNFLFADVQGNIGYRTRGQVPIRSMANAWLPVPGWTGAHEWQGVIPFEEMPRLRNPDTDFIVTANNRIVGDEYPYYIGIDYVPGFRASRILDRLRTLTHARVEDMASIHADRVSIPAREFVALLGRVEPLDALSAQAKAQLQSWDGTMEQDSAAATIYVVFRDHLMRALMEPLLGPLARDALGADPRGGVAHMARLRARLTHMIRVDDRTLLQAGRDWPSLMANALASAVLRLRQEMGDEIVGWQWRRLHRTAPQHTLAFALPEEVKLLNPPSIAMGGDGDTVQAASFSPGTGYTVTGTSVARYVFDLADWNRSAWAVPLGSSGHPGSPHYADQTGAWGAVHLYPMLYDWPQISAGAEGRQRLEPLEMPSSGIN